MLKLASFAILVLCTQLTSAQEKIPVTVYYESLCPDSIKFFTKQLYPSLQGNLSKHIELILVPYGKATQHYNQDLGQWEFDCHHGPNECYGNKVQACAISKIDAGAKTPNFGYNKITVAFINCLMSEVKKEPFSLPIRDCASMNKVQNIVDIENCANHTDGINYLSNLGDTTEKLNPKLTSVPTIVFNSVYNKVDNDLAQTNFQKALCKYIRTDIPAECQVNGSNKFGSSFIVLLSTTLLISFKQMF